MHINNFLEQRISFMSDELKKNLLIRDFSRNPDRNVFNHVGFKVELSPEHFPAVFNEGDGILLFFDDMTGGIRSDWRMKYGERILGVEAEVFYVSDQKAPAVLTLGTSYERSVSRKLTRYIPKAIESGCGVYDLVLRKKI